jgi:hypothetical protein
MLGCEPRQPQSRPDDEHKHGHEDEGRGGDHRGGSVWAGRVTEKTNRRLQVAHIGERVERLTEHGEEAHVDQLEDCDQAQKETDDRRRHPSGRSGQDKSEGYQDKDLDGEPEKGAEGESAELIRKDHREPDEQNCQRGDHPGGTGAEAASFADNVRSLVRPRRNF